MKQKILYFSPINILNGHAGNLTRIRRMLTYFEEKKQYFDVDFVVYVARQDESNPQDRARFREIFPHINLIEIYGKPLRKPYLDYLWKYKIYNFLSQEDKLDYTSPFVRKQFNTLVARNNYNTIVISYVNWGGLVPSNINAHLIIDTHDLVTAQMKIHGDIGEDWGLFFEKECAVLNKFDEIWTYSIEEKYIFEQFTKSKKVTLIPVTFEQQQVCSKEDFKYPILYVASDNQHNVKSVRWYLEHVVPLLGNLVTYMVGPICQKIGDYENVIKLGRVEDLEDTYTYSRVAICPMLSGTGVKIKVLEALSYGTPVVTTARGLDGLVNKTNNGCLMSDDPGEFASHIKRLVVDKSFFNKQREAGLAFIRDNYSREVEETILNRSLVLGMNKLPETAV